MDFAISGLRGMRDRESAQEINCAASLLEGTIQKSQAGDVQLGIWESAERVCSCSCLDGTSSGTSTAPQACGQGSTRRAVESDPKGLRFADVPTIKAVGFMYMLIGAFFVAGGFGISFS